MLQSVRWRGIAAYPLAGRGGRTMCLLDPPLRERVVGGVAPLDRGRGREVSKSVLSGLSSFESGFSSLTSSGSSMVLCRTRDERTFTTFCVSLREMANTIQVCAREEERAGRESCSASKLGRT